MTLDIDGKRMQTGNTSKMIFNINFILSYLSNFMSLQPGDIVTTGTPPGVGDGMNPKQFLKIGNKFSLGLGAVNCKGSAAVHLYLAKNLKKIFPNLKENIDFTFVTDEENLGPDGTRYVRKIKKIKVLNQMQ